MGVRGLWKVIEPTARPVLLESLRGKVLAIDASIWVYHFLKAMRDPSGVLLPAAHIIGFFRRICKLIFFEIKPVFVFDGAPPQLKKQTTARRRDRRENREQVARSTANKLLTLQLQKLANDREQLRSESTGSGPDATVSGSIPSNAVYMGDLVGQSKDSSPAPRRPFEKQDQFHLPQIDRIAPIHMDDQRLLTEEELDEYAKQFTDQARMGFIDTSSVDFHSDQFAKLPKATQYQLLNSARLKSRLRMGYTADQLDQLFPSRMDFSRFQIERVAQRNFFTQKLMNLVGMEEDLTRRVSSEKNTEYVLRRNDEGYTLSLENAGEVKSSQGIANRALKKEEKKEESDDDFEDIDIDIDVDSNFDSKAEPKIDSMDSGAANRALSGSASHEASRIQPLPETVGERIVGEEIVDEESADEGPPKNRDEPELPDFYELAENLNPTTLKKTVAGSSMLFPSAKISQPELKNTVELPETEDSKPSEETAEGAATEKETDAEEVEQPPWFSLDERSDFKAMEVQDNTVSGLMSYGDAQKRLSNIGESDSDLEEVDVRPKYTEPDHDALPEISGEAEDVGAKSPDSATGSSLNEPSKVIEHLESQYHSELVPESVPTSDTEEVIPEFTEEDKNLAEEEEMAEQEANDDLTEMMVGETRENERFARNIAGPNLASSDETDYLQQFSHLRGQMAKTSRDSDAPTTEMIQECQELLQLFGIPYITAPCEAEAQCAVLEELQLVDGIVTDDGDAFLFSDSVIVYRNMFSQAKYVETYNSQTIANELGLTREKTIELALLLGSDYTDGIPGIGPVTGVEILAEFDTLANFKKWWVDAQRFPDQVEAPTSLQKRLLKQFKSKIFLSDDFPSHAVKDAYNNPAVDHDSSAFNWGHPNLEGLRTYLGRVAGWSPERVNEILVPVLQENTRHELLRKTSKHHSQRSLDDYYETVRELNLGSKRAAKATDELRKRRSIR